MKSFTKMLGAALATALLANAAMAADTVAAGKIKSINAENKSFVLTDAADKDSTFRFDDKVVVNRGGVESKTDLKVGDPVHVCHDNGIIRWTAHYILVQAGASKNCELVRGSIKSYDAAKKELTFTNEAKKDLVYPMGKAALRFQMEVAGIENVKIGDHALLIVENVEGTPTLRSVMIDRAK